LNKRIHHLFNTDFYEKLNMKTVLKIASILFCATTVAAQTDTITTDNLKLNMNALKSQKSTYVVFFVDSAGNRLNSNSGELWDRNLQIRESSANQKQYLFSWKMFRKDSLFLDMKATGLVPSFKPLTHDADYFKRGKKVYTFNDNVVTVPDKNKLTLQDSSFRFEVNPHAFEFPMDLEIFELLPFKKVNQAFVIAFYEPGSKKSKYYNYQVVAKEDLVLPGGQKVLTWLLKTEYGKDSYAIFWISDKTREVLKMKERYRTIFRYKVKLY
jgi:hypothetical protein